MPAGGPLTADDRALVLTLLDAGMTQGQVALRLGVTKNTVAGIWARTGRGNPAVPVSTMAQRLDALHARLDAVLAATMGVPRVPNEPPKPRQ